MEVILTQDVPNVGRKYEVKKVKPGYGQNFLVKRGLAFVATPSNLAKLANQKEKHDAVAKAREEALLKSVEGLEAVEIKLSGKANEKGHLFAGFDAEAIKNALKDQANLDFDTDHILVKKPIKDLGEHSVIVKVGEKEASVKLVVEAEK